MDGKVDGKMGGKMDGGGSSNIDDPLPREGGAAADDARRDAPTSSDAYWLRRRATGALQQNNSEF